MYCKGTFKVLVVMAAIIAAVVIRQSQARAECECCVYRSVVVVNSFTPQELDDCQYCIANGAACISYWVDACQQFCQLYFGSQYTTREDYTMISNPNHWGPCPGTLPGDPDYSLYTCLNEGDSADFTARLVAGGLHAVWDVCPCQQAFWELEVVQADEQNWLYHGFVDLITFHFVCGIES